MDDLGDSLRRKAQRDISKDACTPLEVYQKHYQQMSTDLLKGCETTWTRMHVERTQMLFHKENYHNQMFTLNQLNKLKDFSEAHMLRVGK